MASFKQHINLSSLTGVAYGYFLYHHAIVSLECCFLATVLCSLAGLLPDLDCDTGAPINLIFSYMSAVLTVAIIISFDDFENVIKTSLYFIGIFVFINVFVKKGFGLLTVHRGVFHTIPMMLSFSLICILAYSSAGSTIAYSFGFAILLGSLSHLILDEVFSVDLLGIRLKKSFGTALKFLTYHIWIDALNLLIMVGLGFLVYKKLGFPRFFL